MSAFIGVAQWVGILLQTKTLLAGIPVRAHDKIAGEVLGWGGN